MMFLLAGFALYAVYYMAKPYRPEIQYSLWGAAVISTAYFMIMLNVKSDSSTYSFWMQSAFLFFGLILTASILSFLYHHHENLHLKWRIPLLGLAAALFISALFLVHTAIPVFLYRP